MTEAGAGADGERARDPREEPAAAGLDIGLLPRPTGEERRAPRLDGQSQERGDLRRREEAARGITDEGLRHLARLPRARSAPGFAAR